MRRSPGRAGPAGPLPGSGCRRAEQLHKDLITTLGVCNAQSGLDLLQGQPELPQNERYEMQLQAALGPTLVALQGWGRPEAEQAYYRACQLSRDLGDTQRLTSTLYGLATLHEFRGEFFRAKKLMQERLDLRAAASLARLRQAQGNTAEALALLQPVYGRFKEGFATRDLREAKVLLAELSGDED